MTHEEIDKLTMSERLTNAKRVNPVVFQRAWYEVYTSHPDGPGDSKRFKKRSEAYKQAERLCGLGFNDPPRVEVRLDRVTRESRRIDCPDFIQKTIMDDQGSERSEAR